MKAINRVKQMFSGNASPRGDRMFENYYSTLIQNSEYNGPNADEARRDFEGVRMAVSRVSIY